MCSLPDSSIWSRLIRRMSSGKTPTRDPREIFGAFNDLWTVHGYVIEESEYDDKSFGNAWIVLRSGRVCWQLIRDRDEYSALVSLSVEPKEWWDVFDVIEAIGNGKRRSVRARVVAARMLRNLRAIESGFGADRVSMTRAAVKQVFERQQREVERRFARNR